MPQDLSPRWYARPVLFVADLQTVAAEKLAGRNVPM
jgi:hypothetical protein